MNGSICGGVISKSENLKAMRKDVWANAMAIVLPDKHYKEFLAFGKEGKHREAEKVVEEYGISQI